MGPTNAISKNGLDLIKWIDANVHHLNNSKFFTGVVIIMLNIGSRFIDFNLSKSTEKWIRSVLSRHLFVFAVVWMGTRDIYLALIYSSIFVFIIDVLLNDESKYCIIPEGFINEANTVDEEISEEDAKKSAEVVAKYETQKKKKERKNQFLKFSGIGV